MTPCKMTQFHNDICLKINPTLLELYLRHISYCQRTVFCKNKYDQINALQNYKDMLNIFEYLSEYYYCSVPQQDPTKGDLSQAKFLNENYENTKELSLPNVTVSLLERLVVSV